MWKQQVQNIYHTGRSTEQKIAIKDPDTGKTQEGLVIYHQSPLGRHIYIVNNDSLYGKQYNVCSIGLLKTWLAAYDGELNRSFAPLVEIETRSTSLISSYIANAKQIRISQDYKFRMEKPLESEKEPCLIPWKIDGFTIIFDPDRMKFNTTNDFKPQVDICESPDKYQIWLELPGVNKSQRKVIAKKNSVIVEGVKERPYQETTQLDESFMECKYGKFSREFKIPSHFASKPTITPGDKGILCLTFLPFQEEEEIVEDT